MLTRTKIVMAGLATALLFGAAYASAQAPDVEDEGASLGAKWKKGSWTNDNGSIDGRYVSFAYDAQTGTISDYARTLPDGSTFVLFTSIALAEYDASAAKALARGPVLVAKDGDLARAVVFDARNAGFVMGSPAGNTVTLTVADGIGVAYHEEDPAWSPEGVLLTYGNETARLVVRGNASVSVDGQTITVTLGKGGHLGFRIDGHPIEEMKERIFLYKLRHHVQQGDVKEKIREKRDERRRDDSPARDG